MAESRDFKGTLTLREALMKNDKFKRLAALMGVAILLLLFILTIVFLLIGNTPMAITMVACNGLLLFILYFTLRFNRNVHENNPALFPDGDDTDSDADQ